LVPPHPAAPPGTSTRRAGMHVRLCSALSVVTGGDRFVGLVPRFSLLANAIEAVGTLSDRWGVRTKSTAPKPLVRS
jgi:hypothetical protein